MEATRKRTGVDVGHGQDKSGRVTRWAVRCTFCGREASGYWLDKTYPNRMQAVAVANTHREKHRHGSS